MSWRRLGVLIRALPPDSLFERLGGMRAVIEQDRLRIMRDRLERKRR